MKKKLLGVIKVGGKRKDGIVDTHKNTVASNVAFPMFYWLQIHIPSEMQTNKARFPIRFVSSQDGFSNIME